jgi:LAS superfamily LD-carboxypeptidase LdcB
MLYFKTKPPFFRLALVACLVTVNLGFCDAYGSPRVLDSDRTKALDDDARVRLNAAMRELRKRGVRPRVNSTFRSQAEQRAIYRCARNKRCRARRGIYGANQPGTSMHEAGLAVDIGGVASGRRKRRLTPKGRQTVRIMRRHGFNWRYGLKDPAHFEMNPQSAGYRSKQAAIKAGQQRWLQTHRAKRRASGKAQPLARRRSVAKSFSRNSPN